jgi:uncharacterized membrane protein YphA (DoxX/SURF4 family)
MSSEIIENVKHDKTQAGIEWRFYLARGFEVVVGLVLLVAGFIKAVEIGDSIKQAADYKIVTNPTLLTALVWALIAVECAVGAALIVGYKRKIFSLASFGLIAVFLGALGWAWYSGATTDCGCFGSWVNHTPQQALKFDLALLGGLITAQLLSRKELLCHQGMRLALVLLAVVAGLGTAGFASMNPKQSSDPVVRLQASQPDLFKSVTFSDLPVDIKKGTYLFVVLDTGCDHCQANVPNFNELFDKQAGLVPLMAVCPNADSEIKWFKEKFTPKFPLGKVSDKDFLDLLKGGDTPRTFLLKDGGVMKVWDGKSPTEAEVKTALGK